jgi:hypothetical protein
VCVINIYLDLDGFAYRIYNLVFRRKYPGHIKYLYFGRDQDLSKTLGLVLKIASELMSLSLKWQCGHFFSI